jgi:nucleotide-binding universal stress UspA family protein
MSVSEGRDLMRQEVIDANQAAARSLVAGYKDIMVHLDGTPEDENRLAHTEALAGVFSAHLTGVYTNRLPDIAVYSSPVSMMAYVELENQLRADGEIVRKRLAQRFQQLGVSNELRKIEAMPTEMRRAVATEARWADLFVTSCPRGVAGKWSSVVEEALFAGGHGVLLIPEGVKLREAIRTIVIGWVDAPEAARAVAEALPLLRLATSTHVVCVDESAPSVAAIELSDIAAHLVRHGVTTNVSSISDAPYDAAAAILAEASRVSADLIVTGAYGHSRLREWIFGGATHDLIAQSEIPLLMAH